MWRLRARCGASERHLWRLLAVDAAAPRCRRRVLVLEMSLSLPEEPVHEDPRRDSSTIGPRSWRRDGARDARWFRALALCGASLPGGWRLSTPNGRHFFSLDRFLHARRRHLLPLEAPP